MTHTPHDQVVQSDESPTAVTPDDKPERGIDRRKTMILTGVGLGIVVLLWLIADFGSGAPATIASGVLREAISPQTAAVAIAVIGLNIHFGFTGLLNIGQAGFMLLGAYGFAIALDRGMGLILAILVGFVSATVFALLLGIPTLKLRGDY